eukprot:gene22604-29745_t
MSRKESAVHFFPDDNSQGSAFGVSPNPPTSTLPKSAATTPTKSATTMPTKSTTTTSQRSRSRSPSSSMRTRNSSTGRKNQSRNSISNTRSRSPHLKYPAAASLIPANAAHISNTRSRSPVIKGPEPNQGRRHVVGLLKEMHLERQLVAERQAAPDQEAQAVHLPDVHGHAHHQQELASKEGEVKEEEEETPNKNGRKNIQSAISLKWLQLFENRVKREGTPRMTTADVVRAFIIPGRLDSL